jgi:putative membrane protein
MRTFALSEEEKARVAAAITRAEEHTSGEVVPILADMSDPYADVALWWSAGVALLALSVLAAFTPFYLALVDAVLGDWNHEWAPAQVLELALLVATVKLAASWLLLQWRPLRLALTPGWVKHHRVRARAMAAFHLAADKRTSGSTAVLIYLSRAERRAEIIVEAGIAQRVAPDVWGAAMLALLGPVKAGRVADGLVDCMAAVGTVLARHFPREHHDANELPDRLIEL